jgi:hypothetical protein
MAMEKNAVLGPKPKTNTPREKTASSGCPICGRALDQEGSLPRCPLHGTAPFEQRR